jgi:hypothetical protein
MGKLRRLHLCPPPEEPDATFLKALAGPPGFPFVEQLTLDQCHFNSKRMARYRRQYTPEHMQAMFASFPSLTALHVLDCMPLDAILAGLTPSSAKLRRILLMIGHEVEDSWGLKEPSTDVLLRLLDGDFALPSLQRIDVHVNYYRANNDGGDDLKSLRRKIPPGHPRLFFDDNWKRSVNVPLEFQLDPLVPEYVNPNPSQWS